MILDNDRNVWLKNSNLDIWLKNNSIDVNVHCGFFKMALIATLISMCVNMCVNGNHQAASNAINKQRLEVAKKQYTLDSLRYYAPKTHAR